MAEELLDRPQVGAAFEQVRSVRVAERVRVEGAAVGQRMAVERSRRASRVRERAAPRG